MTSSHEKQICRKKILNKLRSIKKEAYSGVTCMEYEAINTVIYLMKLIYDQERDRISKKEADNDLDT